MSQDVFPSYLPPELTTEGRQFPLLKTTWLAVRKLFVESTEALTGYARGRVLVETMSDRRPADGAPYCTLWFKNLEPLAVNVGDFYFDYETEDPDKTIDAVQVLDNESFCTVQFSFWGNGAYNEATRFMQTLHAQRRYHDLWRVVGFAGIDAVQDISAQYGAKIQQRAFFNLDFYVCLGRALPADWFDVSQWGIALPKNKDYKEEFEYSKEIHYGERTCGVS